MPLGDEDGGLPLALGALDRRLPLAVGHVDRRLLETLRLEDLGPLLLVGLLLERQRLEDLRRRGDLDDLDPVDPDPPLVGHGLHLLLDVDVDPLALRQRLVERQRADDRAERGARQRVDGDIEVRDREERLLGVDDLGEDRGVDRDDDVVLGDHFLAIARARVLAHVDRHELVDERRDDRQSRLMDRPELAEPRGHADEALLDEVDRVAQQVEGEQDEQDRDDERDDEREQGCVHGQDSDVTGPDAGLTASVVPRTAVTTTGAPVGIERVVFCEGEPCLTGQPDVARMELVADLVETERALADEAAVDARRQRRLTLALEPAGEERATDDDPEHGDRDGHDGLEPDRAVGEGEGKIFLTSTK